MPPGIGAVYSAATRNRWLNGDGQDHDRAEDEALDLGAVDSPDHDPRPLDHDLGEQQPEHRAADRAHAAREAATADHRRRDGGQLVSHAQPAVGLAAHAR